jgi:FkbH-like protein
VYEAEINPPSALESPVLSEVRDAFRSVSSTITGRTVLPWGEHCTECAEPACYYSCDLYAPRKDGKCRRFTSGMVRIDEPGSLYGYILKIEFKRWAKLRAAGNIRIFPLAEARNLEQEDHAIGVRLHHISNVRQQVFEIGQRYTGKERWALEQRPRDDYPADYFLVECFNPSPSPVSTSLVMQPLAPRHGVGFQCHLEVLPGFNRFRVPIAGIASVLNTSEPFGVEIVPNTTGDSVVLYFGAMDFVHDSSPVSSAALCKVVVWDLDGTLWNGTLAEDGLENLVLKPGIREILTALEQRGLLASIASKNNAEDALAALRRFGLEEYFLFPQLSWIPKASALRRIAAELNIGMDAVAFVDDSQFERASVSSSCPEVRVFDAAEYRTLLDRPELRPMTALEGVNRKDLYVVAQLRGASLAAYDGTYLDFLRDCCLEISIASLTASNIARVHELTQRTNQMNFSGNRYTRPQLETILSSSRWDTYVIDCRDRFGAYGSIGFCLVDRDARLVADLMFSCRVQSKQVEHAFLTHLLQKYRAQEARDVYVNYRPTARNANVARVFDDLGFECVGEEDGVRSLVFRSTHGIVPSNIVTIRDAGPDETA